MAVKTFGSERLTSTDINTYLTNSGLVYVTSVTVGTAVSFVNITSCFSSIYKSYYIVGNGISCSANGAVYAYLLSASTPTSSGVATTTLFQGSGSTGGLIAGGGTNQAYAEVSSQSINGGWNDGFYVHAPYLATYTRFSSGGMSFADDYYRICGGIHKANTSYDGLRITPASGTWTGGTITVYGMRTA